jgi:hypothetical protein
MKSIESQIKNLAESWMSDRTKPSEKPSRQGLFLLNKVERVERVEQVRLFYLGQAETLNTYGLDR